MQHHSRLRSARSTDHQNAEFRARWLLRRAELYAGDLGTPAMREIAAELQLECRAALELLTGRDWTDVERHDPDLGLEHLDRARQLWSALDRLIAARIALDERTLRERAAASALQARRRKIGHDRRHEAHAAEVLAELTTRGTPYPCGERAVREACQAVSDRHAEGGWAYSTVKASFDRWSAQDYRPWGRRKRSARA